MTLTSLLILAAVLGSDESPPQPITAGTATAQNGSAAQVEQPFKAAPLQLGRLGLLAKRELFSLAEPDTNVSHTGKQGIGQQAIVPGVVCPIRIIQADPRLDAALVLTVPMGQVDRIVRDDLSACTR